MAKSYFSKDKKAKYIQRLEMRNHLIDKYYNLWYNSYEWKGINYAQRDYIMRTLWLKGKICAWKLINADSLGLEGEASIGFSDYAPAEYNIYMNYPIKVNLVPEKRAPFIPNKILKVDEDVVIGQAQRNKKGIFDSIEILIDKVVDAEMLIDIIRNTLKMPFNVIVDENNKARILELYNRIANDEEVIVMSVDDINAIKVQANANPYILDKVFQYKKDRENEILTYLGIDNVASEKKEHLIVDEVNANNDIINNSGDCCLDCLKEFCNRISDTLGVSVTVEATAKPITAESNKDFEEDNEDD